MRARAGLLLVAFSFLASLANAGAAQAASQGSWDITNCAGRGSFVGSGANSLSNGTLSAGFCRYSAGGVSTATVKYAKTAGAAVTATLCWEFVSANGSTASGRTCDPEGSFTISAGQTFSQRWPYASPGRYSPSGTTPCLRGVLKVGPDAFSTRVVC